MTRLKLLAVALAASLVAACGGGGGPAAQDTSPRHAAPSGTTSAPTAPAVRQVALPTAPIRFGGYASVPALDPDAPRYRGPATPASLDEVHLGGLRYDLAHRKGLGQALMAQGFVVDPDQAYSLMHYAYAENWYGNWPVFVTTDVGYHEWHVVFDKVLRDLEQTVLLPKLETLVAGLVASSDAQADALDGTPLAGDADRVRQLMRVAAAELGLPVTLGPLAAEEKALIDAHSATTESPILGTTIDYSNFTPRGHYTRNAALRRYFVAMSVLGQSAFCLPQDRECPGLGPARRAILASRALVTRPDLVAVWRQIYEPTGFLVGSADDYTPLEVMRAAPAAVAAPGSLADDADVRSAISRLVASRAVRINPDHPSVRLMGTRFVVDGFILDRLMYPYVGTEANKRLLPSGLDVAATFGSDFAYGALKAEGETAYAHYDTQMTDLRTAVASRPAEDWGSTVYDAWLYALAPVFVRHGTAFPAFMRTGSWAAKDLQTGMGSYAELKHDTVLYAKQALAEGGGEPPRPRRNWVEPDPVAFARLASTARLLRVGLAQRGLLNARSGVLLTDTARLLEFFARMAGDELAGRPISRRDNARLTFVGGRLGSLFWRASDRTADGVPTIDQDAAIVADIASSPAGVREVATGRFNRIYVLVPDDSGHFQVAAGGVYSYYEFTSPPGQRLDDASWRAQLDAGTAPERPGWQTAMFPK